MFKFSSKLFFFSLVGLLIFFPLNYAAAESCSGHTLEVPIFGADKICFSGPGAYLIAIYSFSLGAGVIYAVILMSIGALQYGSSRDNANQKKEGLDRFKAALAGLFLLFATNLFLRTINPDLLNLTSMEGSQYFKNIGITQLNYGKNLATICSSYYAEASSCLKTCQENVSNSDSNFKNRDLGYRVKIFLQSCYTQCKPSLDSLSKCFSDNGAAVGNSVVPSP